MAGISVPRVEGRGEQAGRLQAGCRQLRQRFPFVVIVGSSLATATTDVTNDTHTRQIARGEGVGRARAHRARAQGGD